MSTPKETPERGIPVGRMLIILSVLLVLGLGYLGARDLFGGIVLTTPPVAGEWQAHRKLWRITFKPDKTLVSSTSPSQSDASQQWTSGAGTYTVNFFGTLWVTLDNGKIYSAALKADMPNRFDLIEFGTEDVTVFERVQPIKPKPGYAPKDALGRSGS
jgi:hypothetical protein